MLLPLFQNGVEQPAKNIEKSETRTTEDWKDVEHDGQDKKHLIYNPLLDQIKTTNKTLAELNEILPNLKRIVFVDFLLKEELLKEFLIIAEPWIRSRNILLYFPKIDAKDIRNLAIGTTEDDNNDDKQHQNDNSNIVSIANANANINTNAHAHAHANATTLANANGTNINDNNLDANQLDGNSNGSTLANAKKSAKDKKDNKFLSAMTSTAFEWSHWKDHLKPVRLSVHRWKESSHYLLYLRATAWKMWWLRDIQLKNEVFFNLVH
ncbi:hypothetical protein RFI_18239 [Reticulomyxa filosa]|uniref:Uncharacterized protein n=1 Tax=Reticulomyxa filosa TaxID=46433 RepID=X6N0Z9_RETFI|nr:hypothetical protein RFI_18239 [Reticulomyxa filosa]|eukprot:ETO19002.1 hypothetical protein RFI_18239 [Reticulomyxa filosa]